MEIAKVVFGLGNETRDIHCYQISAKGEKGFFYDEKIYTSLLPIIESRIKRANSRVRDYQRDCPGKRYALQDVDFWENQFAGRGATILKGGRNDRTQG